MLNRLSDFQNVKPRDVNKIIDAVNRVGDIMVAPPLELSRQAGRVQIRLAPDGFVAFVSERVLVPSSTSSFSSTSTDPYGVAPVVYHTTYKYLCNEVEPLEGGLWREIPEGRSVWATEFNDALVAIGSVVAVAPYLNQEWRFQFSGDGEDSSSSCTSGCSDPTVLDVLNDECESATLQAYIVDNMGVKRYVHWVES